MGVELKGFRLCTEVRLHIRSEKPLSGRFLTVKAEVMITLNDNYDDNDEDDISMMTKV